MEIEAFVLLNKVFYNSYINNTKKFNSNINIKTNRIL